VACLFFVGSVIMARNEEKAQSMLNRWLKMKEEKRSKRPTKRPHLASECSYLPDAEKWRHEVIKEIVKDVALIQNESLGEYRVRELNDNINKRLREKMHWEKRIAELGGRKYSEINQKIVDDEGNSITILPAE
jgi:pre-mRNA-splicing factor ISY1